MDDLRRSRRMLGKEPSAGALVPGVLAEAWGLEIDDLRYREVGLGSWHWSCTAADGQRLFVTLDSVEEAGTGFDPLVAAYGVPLALAAAGSVDVRPPLPTRTGDVLVPLDDVWCVSVWPHLDGRTLDSGTYADPDDADAVLRVLRRLHDLPASAASPPVETFELEERQRLLDLLDALDRPWDGGPYGEGARALVTRSADAILRLIAHHDELVAAVPPKERWVLTHGEPHGANVVFVPDGDGDRPVLIDWDAALLAPRERDVWMLLANPRNSVHAYGDHPLDSAVLELYRARWDLDEIAIFGGRLAGPHTDDPYEQIAIEALRSYLAVEERWPALRRRTVV